MYLTERPENGRGCGDREEGAGYGCCGLSRWGKPVEEFVLDPVRPILWQRGMHCVPRDPTKPDGIHDIIVGVGIDPKGGKTEGYPSAWSFVEEVRHFGASRKFPKNFPFHKLTPFETRMIFVHARAIPMFEYVLNRDDRPLYGCKRFQDWVDNKQYWEKANVHPEYHPYEGKTSTFEKCAFALRDLSYLLHETEPLTVVDSEVNRFRVQMPSFQFIGIAPLAPSDKFNLSWASGAFLVLPLTHVEFPKRRNEKVTEELHKVGIETAVTEW